MKATDLNTMAASGNIHPHRHRTENVGPFALRIGIRSQPDIVRNWAAKTVSLGIEQTQEDTNFTLLRVSFLLPGRPTPGILKGVTMRRAKLYRKGGGVLEVRLRKRWTDGLTHPLPQGQYTGNCVYDVDGGFAVFTLQATSLRKEPEPQKPKTIITPGDADFDVTLADAKRTLSGVDGLAGGGANAGGLRHG